MIDLHTHIVFDVDDGSKSIQDSLEILKIAHERGIKAMFATPHFIEGYVMPDALLVKERVLELSRHMKTSGLDMPIYSGHEIMLDYNTLDHLKEGRALSLNDTRYVLVEMPMHTQLNNLNEIFFNFQVSGYVPVIAHPERYDYVQDNPALIEDWITKGALLQINLLSLYNKYGDKAKKTAIKLLKSHMYHFVGSDVHSHQSTALSVSTPLAKIKELVDHHVYKDIVHNNPMKLIKNQEIRPFELVKVRRSIIDKIKGRFK